MIDLGALWLAFLTLAYPEFLAASWRPWRLCAAVLFGLPVEGEADQALVRECTGRTVLPSQPAREGWWVIGRRGGKSRFTALLAVFLACVKDYSSVLAPGEKGIVMLLAADRRQGRVLKRYVSGLLASHPSFAAMVVSETAERIELNNRIVIEIHTSSFRSLRGYTVVAALCDEIAFWDTGEEAANPDTEILNALRPAMSTIPGALLLALSSPYARRGELWRMFDRHFGKDDDPILVWNADTRTMNPRVPETFIAAAYAEDEAAASAEYGGKFRTDIEKFVSLEVVDAVTIGGRERLTPQSNATYQAFVDASGGVHDSMTLCIAHRGHDGRAVMDQLLERRPPFSPDGVVTEFANELRYYRISTVQGDRYGGEWPRERFQKHGIGYRLADLTASELYQALLPLLTSGRCELLDLPRLSGQLVALERKTTRNGRDVITHPPRGTDDVANAAAGALALVAKGNTVRAGMLDVPWLN